MYDLNPRVEPGREIVHRSVSGSNLPLASFIERTTQTIPFVIGRASPGRPVAMVRRYQDQVVTFFVPASIFKTAAVPTPAPR